MRNFSTVTIGSDQDGKIHVWDDLSVRLLCRPMTIAPIWGRRGSEVTCKTCVVAAEKLGIVEHRKRKQSRKG